MTATSAPAAVPISTPFSGLRMARPPTKPVRMQMVRKQPPAFDVLGMRAPMPEQGQQGQAKHGQRIVDDLCRQSGNGRLVKQGAWTVPSSIDAWRLPTRRI